MRLSVERTHKASGSGPVVVRSHRTHLKITLLLMGEHSSLSNFAELSYPLLLLSGLFLFNLAHAVEAFW
ncbi:hypothetical protein CEXT_378801 [Caerostris extrusa]|uniref:Uncharacterized protein n=1 Tax=Caerostris extrusa TaxID=172846 RepID=A0AAV4SK10_CAEEX|nr:hypothetical protein CEXT_378801 [Caerostris extrusa]